MTALDVTEAANEILKLVYAKYPKAEADLIKCALETAAKAVETTILADAIRASMFKALNK